MLANLKTKRLLALIVLVLNGILIVKIIQKEIKWFNAHRKVWPVLTKTWKIDDKIPDLKTMIKEEQIRYNNSLQKNHPHDYRLMNSVFNEEHYILANMKQVDSIRESLLRKKARVLDRISKKNKLEEDQPENT